MTLDLGRYFGRIGFRATARPDIATLERLHALHPEHIAFENLSPFLGEAVRLDPASLQEKLVAGGRGGWCFEHNMLFSQVLIEIGFRVTRLAARVYWNRPKDVVPARSHMLMRVQLDGRDYIADVGFGGLTLTAPLRIVDGIEQKTRLEPHRLSATPGGHVVEAKLAGEWQALYAFDLAEQQLADYEVSNWYLCNHPESQFVTGVLAARAASDRRYTLRNTRFSEHHPGGETERRFITDVGEYRRTLEEVFLIRLPAARNLDAKLAAMIAANPPS